MPSAQMPWFEPTVAVVGDCVIVIVTSANEAGHGEFEIVQRKTIGPVPAKPVSRKWTTPFVICKPSAAVSKRNGSRTTVTVAIGPMSGSKLLLMIQR